MGIKDDVVRSAQAQALHLVIQPFEFAGVQVHPFDAPATVVGGLANGAKATIGLGGVVEAAVVANIDRPIGTDGRAVGAATQISHHGDPAVSTDPGQRAPRDFDQQHRAVVHGDWALGKLQTTGEFSDFHAASPDVAPSVLRERMRVCHLCARSRRGLGFAGLTIC